MTSRRPQRRYRKAAAKAPAGSRTDCCRDRAMPSTWLW